MKLKKQLWIFLLLLNTALSQDFVDLRLRWGEGGFTDSRSDLGVLGGGQLTLDIQKSDMPWGISLSGEYYTNSPFPTHSYEIQGATFLNLLYMDTLLKYEDFRWFTSLGTGYVEVPEDGTQGKSYFRSMAYNAELGFDYRLIWDIGFYGIYKYLYAQKSVDGLTVVDFDEHIGLFGLTYSFSF